jgi:hypothetical protein
MNRVLYYSSIILLFFAGVIACRKPSADVRDPDKLRISRIQRISPAINTVFVTDFIYDDQQRVDKISASSGNIKDGNLITNYVNSVKYYYNGTNKNPYKASGAFDVTSNLDVFYTYNKDGILIKDSAIGPGLPSIRVRDYTYATDKLIVKNSQYPGIDSFLIKNNNITEIVYGVGDGTPSNLYFQLSYDNKINPLSKLNIASVKIVEGLNGFFTGPLAPGFCRNNITDFSAGGISLQGEHVQTSTESYSHTYTKEGLPETCTTTYYTYKYSYEAF